MLRKKFYPPPHIFKQQKKMEFCTNKFLLNEVTDFNEKINYQKAEDCKRIYYVKSETQTGLDTHSEWLFQQES